MAHLNHSDSALAIRNNRKAVYQNSGTPPVVYNGFWIMSSDNAAGYVSRPIGRELSQAPGRVTRPPRRWPYSAGRDGRRRGIPVGARCRNADSRIRGTASGQVSRVSIQCPPEPV